MKRALARDRAPLPSHALASHDIDIHVVGVFIAGERRRRKRQRNEKIRRATKEKKGEKSCLPMKKGSG